MYDYFDQTRQKSLVKFFVRVCVCMCIKYQMFTKNPASLLYSVYTIYHELHIRIKARLQFLRRTKCTALKWSFIPFDEALWCWQRVPSRAFIDSNSFQKIDKISYAQLLCMVCCSVRCIVYNINRVYVSWIRPFMYVLGWVCRVWGELMKSVYTIKRFESDRKWWCDKIYKNTVSFQFVHKLVPNLFKLIKINGVSIIIYCSLFFFFGSIFRFLCVKYVNATTTYPFFGRVWLYILFTYITLFYDKDTVWNFAWQRVNWWGW